MKERPILFSASMVRAILAGTKTQTRRVVKPSKLPDGHWMIETRGDIHQITHWDNDTAETSRIACPYGQPGDRLWVREAFGHFERNDTLKPGDTIFYRADGEAPAIEPWRPSIHMPRWASRITLEVEAVRVERLQEISEADALAEGIVPVLGGYGLPDGSHFHAADPRVSYWSLWDAINGAGSVEANPYVWVVSFRRI